MLTAAIAIAPPPVESRDAHRGGIADGARRAPRYRRSSARDTRGRGARSQSGSSTNGALREPRVRNARDPGSSIAAVTEQQEVEVERARRVALRAAQASRARSIASSRSSSARGERSVSQARYRVQVRPLVARSDRRSGLVDARQVDVANPASARSAAVAAQRWRARSPRLDPSATYAIDSFARVFRHGASLQLHCAASAAPQVSRSEAKPSGGHQVGARSEPQASEVEKVPLVVAGARGSSHGLPS